MDSFHQTLTQVGIWICRTNDKQNGRQNACLSVCSCGHSNFKVSHLSPISSKFHIRIPFIKLWPKFKYRFCLKNNNQHGCQNRCGLWSVCTCEHSNLVIYHPIASKFDVWISFIKRSHRFLSL